jgi:hypothetical protein
MNRLSSTIAVALLISAVPQIAQPNVFPVGPSFVAQHKTPPQEELRIFTGTIVSVSGEAFALKEAKTDMLYGLDNQALAHQFAGKMVTVTGTLDKAAMIHVENIEEQKA